MTDRNHEPDVGLKEMRRHAFRPPRPAKAQGGSRGAGARGAWDPVERGGASRGPWACEFSIRLQGGEGTC